MRDKGKVLEGMIQRFGQNIIDGLNSLIKDIKKIKGNVYEEMIQKFGKKYIDSVNDFPVTDAIIKEGGGHIISVGRGTPDYLWDKIQVLFNVKVTATGVRFADLKKFELMQFLLQKKGKIQNLLDYVNRARLLIPDHAVLPLKAIITLKVKDPIWRDRMLNAVISEL